MSKIILKYKLSKIKVWIIDVFMTSMVWWRMLLLSLSVLKCFAEGHPLRILFVLLSYNTLCVHPGRVFLVIYWRYPVCIN